MAGKVNDDTKDSTDKLEAPATAAQTSASDPAPVNPLEVQKTFKKDAVKVTDGDPQEDRDPHRGQGGAYTIDNEGRRVRVENDE